MAERGLKTSLISFAPSPKRWPAALTAAIAMAVPVAVATFFGLTPLGLLTGLGAFTALYCAPLSRRDRLRVLPLIGAGLVTAAALGVAMSGSRPLTAIGLIVVGSVVIWLVQGIVLGPPGALFFILVFGIAGHLTAPVPIGGAGLDGGLVILLVAAGSAFASLVVVAPLLVPAVRRSAGKPTPMRVLFPEYRLSATDRRIATRLTVALAISAVLGAVLGLGHGYWIAGSAVAILSVGHSRTLSATRGVHRVLGTVVGAGIFLAVASLQPHGYILALVLAALQFTIELVVIRHYALALVFITPLVLIISTSSSTQPVLAIVGERVLDTLLGAAVAMLLLLVSWGHDRRRAASSDAPGTPPIT
ncbi:FUSC family protein [Plantibacter sp. VKM Ac-2885]|uniref:FUSC family protein n=1 Tax=Plantibacter sp. VKM Ac-2885 TaxID=2783828 RepID=UPI00188BD3ED|nr:FUSC family protein [Plantibacter sp. VKM Ac-2885]MBF4514625.1 FUSC family protein [Plantibacter sp. VKM Ac-2885]